MPGRIGESTGLHYPASYRILGAFPILALAHLLTRRAAYAGSGEDVQDGHRPTDIVGARLSVLDNDPELLRERPSQLHQLQRVDDRSAQSKHGSRRREIRAS